MSSERHGDVLNPHFSHLAPIATRCALLNSRPEKYGLRAPLASMGLCRRAGPRSRDPIRQELKNGIPVSDNSRAVNKQRVAAHALPAPRCHVAKPAHARAAASRLSFFSRLFMGIER